MKKFSLMHAAPALTAIASMVLLMTAMSSCIKNDIPYPRIQPCFSTFVVEYQSRDAKIDSISRTVEITLSEEADIDNVVVSSYTLTCGQVDDPAVLEQPINLNRPVTVSLSLYQQYQWTITASQQIDRYFTVRGQIGTTIIDTDAHRVVAYVPETVDLRAIDVLSMKLGGVTATMSPDLTGQTVNFANPVKVIVEEHGRQTEWTIYVEPTIAIVTTTRVDAWTCVAFAYADGQDGRDNGFEYRMQGDADWTRVPDAWVTHDGGSFSARILHLTPLTNYEVRAFSGEDFGNEIEFTTGDNPQLPNGTMDDWWLDGKIWCPWPEGGLQWWDTGNKGASTLGESNTIPTDDTSSGTGRAALCQTKFVGIGPIGKLAAGNIYVGKFRKVDGTNGILDMGKPFTERPTKVAGYYKYRGGAITNSSRELQNLIGRPDTCSIWIALTDGPAPVEIRTNPNNRKLFNPDDPEVIAYGELLQVEDVDKYTRFEVEFKYKSTDRKPTYILVTASASKLGDFFTGCNTAVLWVDDFELMYDY